MRHSHFAELQPTHLAKSQPTHFAKNAKDGGILQTGFVRYPEM
jgi:hypothetical protein